MDVFFEISRVQGGVERAEPGHLHQLPDGIGCMEAAGRSVGPLIGLPIFYGSIFSYILQYT